MRGGIVEDLQALQRKCTSLEQLAVASPVNQCVQEGCQWRDKQATLDRMRDDGNAALNWLVSGINDSLWPHYLNAAPREIRNMLHEARGRYLKSRSQSTSKGVE
jgi:hypothetical protein